LNPSPASGKKVGGGALAQFRARTIARHRVATSIAARLAINDTIIKKVIEDS
jgi:hypothetical protein